MAANAPVDSARETGGDQVRGAEVSRRETGGLEVRGLEVRGLSVGAWDGAPPIQRGVDLSLAPGERVALSGPSGCGKTTLLRAIATLDDAVEGALRLDGSTPDEIGYPAWRRRVAYVSQRASFFGGTVEDELARPFDYAAAARAFDPAEAEEALAALGLADKWSAESRALSEGEGQRVALVRAALGRPSVLLLDEPTSALDAALSERVEAWLAARACAILLVSHDAAQRARFTERQLVLEAR